MQRKLLVGSFVFAKIAAQFDPISTQPLSTVPDYSTCSYMQTDANAVITLCCRQAKGISIDPPICLNDCNIVYFESDTSLKSWSCPLSGLMYTTYDDPYSLPSTTATPKVSTPAVSPQRTPSPGATKNLATTQSVQTAAPTSTPSSTTTSQPVASESSAVPSPTTTKDVPEGYTPTTTVPIYNTISPSADSNFPTSTPEPDDIVESIPEITKMNITSQNSTGPSLSPALSVQTTSRGFRFGVDLCCIVMCFVFFAIM